MFKKKNRYVEIVVYHLNILGERKTTTEKASWESFNNGFPVKGEMLNFRGYLGTIREVVNFENHEYKWNKTIFLDDKSLEKEQGSE